jgi:twitching motility protein PilJ
MISLGDKENRFLTDNDGVKKGRSINKKVTFIGVAIMGSILVMAVLFAIESLLSGQNKEHTALISEQQVVSYQISLRSLESTEGDASAFDELVANKRRLITILNRFDNDAATLWLSPLSSGDVAEYLTLKDVWNHYESNIDTVISAKALIGAVGEDVTAIRESLPELILLAETVIDELVKVSSPRSDIAIAAHQLVLVNGLEKSMNQILTEGDVIVAASDQFTSDSAFIERQLLAMLDGNNSLGINRFSGHRVIDNLVQFADLYSVVKKNVQQIIDHSPKLFEVHAAAQNIQLLREDVRILSKKLLNVINTKNDQLQILTFVGYGIGVVALFLVALLISIVVRESRSSLLDSQGQTDKDQRAILRLLDEMRNLADGDLSVHTTVNEDITGAIADSVNYSIDAYRYMVGTIKKTVVKVIASGRKTHAITRQLEEASNAQVARIATVSASVKQISKSMLSVSGKATDSVEVARQSVNIAQTGSKIVKHTIDRMEAVRLQMQEASTRIKRLGESSQEIADIVNLITEISDQTNILALNAEIQATMAGEAGQGFAVVADEVQRLAERTGDATKRMEALVKAIQADTNEAALSMEKSAANVAKGTKLTEDSGSAMNRIERLSMNLAQRILVTSEESKSLASESIKLTQAMDIIQKITLKIAEGSVEAKRSIGELSGMVTTIRKSVAGFKLPRRGALGNRVVNNAEALANQNLDNSSG